MSSPAALRDMGYSDYAKKKVVINHMLLHVPKDRV